MGTRCKGEWIGYDNSDPPQLWCWRGPRDETAEPICRLPELTDKDMESRETIEEVIRGND